MMDYKFWITDERKMYESHEVGFIDLFGGRIQINNEWKFFDKERYGDKVNCIPLQFTGLKDKKGIKIYESDVLRWYPQNPNNHIDVVISWDETTASFFFGAWYENECPNTEIDSLVIRNVYEKTKPLGHKP